MLLWTAAVLVLLLGSVLWTLYGPNTFDGAPERTLTISKGQTFTSVVDSLEALGMIRSRTLFEWTSRLYGGTERIQVGRYAFSSGVSNADIFLRIRSGEDNQLITVVIREGLTSRAQARIYARNLGIDSARYMLLVHDPGFIGSFGIRAPSLEGYLLPQTYRFTWQQNEEDVISAMVKEFQEFFADSLEERSRAMRWTTNQVVTLASIVEGEAVLPEEREVIAGVYHNRLRKRMRLEADPTIQFVIPDGPRRLRYSDLRIRSPYNTYLNYGLPPGPVNNPGRESILAALYPAHHDYLFFVANGKGGHWFSSSYAQHKRFVRQYRRERQRG